MASELPISRRPPAADLKVVMLATASLTPYAGNARKHSKKQIAQIAASIREFGFVAPVLVADDNSIIAGHGRVLAAQSLDMDKVPTVRLPHLSPAQRRAYIIADNRLAELATWDLDLLAGEVQDLVGLDLDFEIELTGFEGAALDKLLDPPPKPDKADRIPEAGGPAVTRLGDIWVLGKHRLFCGDARDQASYQALMGAERARMAFTDPPYNVAIDRNVGGLGKIARREFVMGSSELSPEAFRAFLSDAFRQMAAVSLDGAIHYACMDWRHWGDLQAAGAAAYGELKHMIVWVKDNAGLGTFYRSRHELIGVFKVGAAPHLNNFGLGETGRYRTNVWEYPGISAFGPGRDEALAMHPTVKPVAMVADAIKDVSKRNDIVLDPFGGSGTTLIAAQKTGRRARLIELDPLYCDVICRRWTKFSGEAAILEATGQAFADVAAERLAEAGDA